MELQARAPGSGSQKSFDALCLGWALGSPPEDPRQLWYSNGAKEQGSSNAVGFANAEADEIINKLTFEADPERRMALYHRFHAIMHEEQPYTFLYEGKRIAACGPRLKDMTIDIPSDPLARLESCWIAR